ncbi:MAG: hypothetical protein ACYTFG_22850, partial [Planctomycetota bacterium]
LAFLVPFTILSCSDFKPDAHFFWGPGGGSSGSGSPGNLQAFAIGWIGGGVDGWRTDLVFNPGGNDYRSFNQPTGVFVTQWGEIYVADWANNRVCRWGTDGTAMSWIGGGSDGWKTGPAPAAGTGPRQFYGPSHVFVDSNDGEIYVSDEQNNRVCRWTTSGSFMGWIGGGMDTWQNGNAPIPTQDYRGFDQPEGLFLTDMDELYVVDRLNHRVCRWDVTTGTAIGWIGSGSSGWSTASGANQGSNNNSFNEPWDVQVDPFGTVYVTDSQNARICRWDPGGFSGEWIGGGMDGWQTGNAPSPGSDYRSFNQPMGLHMDNAGNLYITDFQNSRVTRWDNDGMAKGWLGGGRDGYRQDSGADMNWDDIRDFDGPGDVHVDVHGDIYVASWGGRVQRWNDPTAHSVGKIFFSSDRDGNGELYSMDLDGGNQYNITQSSSSEESRFHWNPWIRQILFTTDRDGDEEIYAQDSIGSFNTRLTNNPAIDTNARWAPDASLIVFFF